MVALHTDEDISELIRGLQLADMQEQNQAGLEPLAAIRPDRTTCEGTNRTAEQEPQPLDAEETHEQENDANNNDGDDDTTSSDATGSVISESDTDGDPGSDLAHKERLEKIEARSNGIENYTGENKGLRVCVACGSETSYFDIVRLLCTDEYCIDCLTNLFRCSIKDESRFPSRCCGRIISIDFVDVFLPSDVVEEFHKKDIEYSTDDRTYCHQPSCSAFIDTSKDLSGSEATCPECKSKTCTLCKGAFHDDACPENTETQTVLQLANEQGWQRCSQCHRIVELNTGCYHITCVCRAQFCYLCGLRWKTCQCPQFDKNRRAGDLANGDAAAREVRAIAEMRAVVHRWWDPNRFDEGGRDEAVMVRRRWGHIMMPFEEALAAADEVPRVEAARPADGPEQLQRSHRPRNNLVDNSECTHARWKWFRGRSRRCDQCNMVQRSYIFECRQCRTLACNRCRHNRV